MIADSAFVNYRSLSAFIDKNSNLDDLNRKKLLETALEESERLNSLVGNLLDMARMEAGALRIHENPAN